MDKKEYIILLERIIGMSRDIFNQYVIEPTEYEEKKRSTGEILGFGVVIYLSSIKQFTKVRIFPFFTISEKKIFSIDIDFIINNRTRVFSIKDYTTARNIPFNANYLYKWLEKYEDSLEITEQLFITLKEILEFEEIQRLLNTDYTIDIPIDYTPYK